MSHIAKELLQDCSTQDEFSYSLRCAQCGETWKSRPSRFSKAGVQPESKGKRVVFDILYRREQESAQEKAVAEAAAIFNLCPICHRLVCDHCFLICDDLDMCQSCADDLMEKGEFVLSRGSAG